jgi:hypothetical protein
MPSPPSTTGRTVWAVTSRWRRPASRPRSFAGLLDRAAGDRGHDLAGELLALHARDLEHLDAGRGEVADPGGDRRLDAARELLPAEGGPLDPATLRVDAEVAALLHRAQQFDGEERVTAGAHPQLRPEVRAERVRFAVDHGLDERRVVGLGEVDQVGQPGGPQLAGGGDGGRRRPRLRGDLLTPERSDEEHACAAEPAREVEEELHRSGIDPLQVVEEDEKAPVLRQVAEEGRELLEERQPEVVSGRRSACGALCQGGEPREALGAHAGVPMGEAMERAGRDEASEQRWGTIEKGIDGVGQGGATHAAPAPPASPGHGVAPRPRRTACGRRAGTARTGFPGRSGRCRDPRPRAAPGRQPGHGARTRPAARTCRCRPRRRRTRCGHPRAPPGGGHRGGRPVLRRERRRATHRSRLAVDQATWRRSPGAPTRRTRPSGSTPRAASSRAPDPPPTRPPGPAATPRAARAAAARCPWRASNRRSSRCACSSSGSSVSQRRVAASAAVASPRCRCPSASVRSTRTTSPCVCSRIEAAHAANGPASMANPSRNSPRTSPAARSSRARRPGSAACSASIETSWSAAWSSTTSTRASPRFTRTSDGPARRNGGVAPPSSRTYRRLESALRRLARAMGSERSCHSRSARVDLDHGRPDSEAR